jgi:hypothetical protein
MVAFEAQVHIFVKIPSAINEATSFVTARRRDFESGILKLGEWKQSPPLADQVQVPPVSEVVQKRDSAERIDLHADSLFDPKRSRTTKMRHNTGGLRGKHHVSLFWLGSGHGHPIRFKSGGNLIVLGYLGKQKEGDAGLFGTSHGANFQPAPAEEREFGA